MDYSLIVGQYKSLGVLSEKKLGGGVRLASQN